MYARIRFEQIEHKKSQENITNWMVFRSIGRRSLESIESGWRKIFWNCELNLKFIEEEEYLPT